MKRAREETVPDGKANVPNDESALERPARDGGSASSSSKSLIEEIVRVQEEGGLSYAPNQSYNEATDVSGPEGPRLYVGNLDFKVNEIMILKIFSAYGRVLKCNFLTHLAGPHRGRSRGFCFVEYTSMAEAAAAIDALDGRRLCGRTLRVRYVMTDGGSGDSQGGRPGSSGSSVPAAMSEDEYEMALRKRIALLKAQARSDARGGGGSTAGGGSGGGGSGSGGGGGGDGGRGGCGGGGGAG